MQANINHQEISDFLLSFDQARLDFPFGEDTEVYRIGETDEKNKIFALIVKDSQPVRLSLRCDPQLAETLRERYETVLPGNNLDRRRWNTIICSGQLSFDELKDLMRHSYEIASAN